MTAPDRDRANENHKPAPTRTAVSGSGALEPARSNACSAGDGPPGQSGRPRTLGLRDLDAWVKDDDTSDLGSAARSDEPPRSHESFIVRQLRLRPDFDPEGWEKVRGKWRYKPSCPTGPRSSRRVVDVGAASADCARSSSGSRPDATL